MPSKDQGMRRPDGTKKSNMGYLGQVKRDDGGIMTEYSTNVEEINEAFGDSKFSYKDSRGVKVVDFPTLVPTLDKQEVEMLRTLPDGTPIPKQILMKAADHAAMRLKEGKSPFFQDNPKKKSLIKKVMPEPKTKKSSLLK